MIHSVDLEMRSKTGGHVKDWKKLIPLPETTSTYLQVVWPKVTVVKSYWDQPLNASSKEQSLH